VVEFLVPLLVDCLPEGFKLFVGFDCIEVIMSPI